VFSLLVRNAGGLFSKTMEIASPRLSPPPRREGNLSRLNGREISFPEGNRLRFSFAIVADLGINVIRSLRLPVRPIDTS